MKIHFRRLPSGMVIVALLFLFAGCGASDEPEQKPQALYKQAAAFSRSRDYLKAIECYSRAIIIDSVQVNAPRVVQALYEKRRLEGFTGEYYEALKTAARLEKLPIRAISDSLRNQLFADQAILLRELGNFKAAAASMEKIALPVPRQRLELADLLCASGEYEKAALIYRDYTGSASDPATRITAFAGLLRCKVAQPELRGESAEAIAAHIAAESKRVFAGDGELVPRIQAIRVAAQSLLLLEKQRRNASYLLFRALTLAEQSQNQFLIQVLRLESNAVIVQKADAFREAADYFRINNLQYAQAASLFMLSSSKSLKASERIAALQQGFALGKDFAPPSPAAEHLQLEKHAGRRLTALLMEQSRIFELFDAQEKQETLALKRTLLRYPNSFALGKGHEALEAKVRRLQHEMAALLQRKATIFTKAEGIEQNREVDRALNIKRGKMLELLAEVRAINPLAADAMQLTPVTLPTVQSALREDQLIVKPLLSDSLCGALLIGKRQVQIINSPLSFDAEHTPDAAIRALRRDIASKATSAPAPLPDSEQAWLSSAFYKPLAGSISGFKHVVVIADELFPFQMLATSQLPASQQRFSFVQSLKEFVLLSAKPSVAPTASQIAFYRAENIAGARLHKLFSPRDRIFLLWKPFSGSELELFRQKIAQEMQRRVSGSEALLLLGNGAEGDKSGEKAGWHFLSSYGVD